MGNNKLKGTNDILVKADHNNLIYIDPNSVLNNGVVEPRAVEPENLVMYVNLEADLIPRSILTASDNKNTLLSIAKGTLNFLQNKDGKNFDTTWTDAYTDVKASSSSNDKAGVVPISDSFRQTDETGQSFGIDNISIQVAGANFIPRVVIKFIDVRGKTLFDSPANSPYSAFFHLPWPIFYLTVKGYYGKAIKYRLHMVKFNSRYNSQNGNFEVQCDFVGSTYAYLADISLESILNAPYFYASENVISEETNTGTGVVTKTVSKSSKGYRVLKSIYQEYINKGLLPPDFPVKTLREVIILTGRLDKILEEQVFPQIINYKVLAGVKDFEDTISRLEQQVLAWKSIHLSPTYYTNGTRRKNVFTGEIENVRWFNTTGKDKNTLLWITGSDKSSTLEFILKQAIDKLDQNETFGSNRNISITRTEKIKTNSISLSLLKDITHFYDVSTAVGVDIDGVLDAVYVVQKDFVEQRNKLEEDIEKQMNDVIKAENGLGFEPTVRNIMGVVLANAETYIRLMKDVHQKAFEVSSTRKKILKTISTDSLKSEEAIYPWPEIKLQSAGGKELVLVYPGSRDISNKLQSDDSILWPEVDFVENFYTISTHREDNLTGTAGTTDSVNYVFDSKMETFRKDIGVFTNLLNYIPYSDKSISSILYEIYERAKYTTSLNSFANAYTMTELAIIEYGNLEAQILNDIDVVDMLKTNITSLPVLRSHIAAISPYDRFPYFLDQLPTISYIREALDQDFKVQKYVKNTTSTENYNSEYPNVISSLANYVAEDYRISIYPFNSPTYLSYLSPTKTSLTKNDLDLNGLLSVNTPDDFISSPVTPTMWVKDGYTTNLFDYTIKINEIDKHLLNTPYFHKQLYNDFTKSSSQEKYVGSAYLLLNSLPLKDLDDYINTNTLMSSLFREVGASHYVPYHLMLKWGSIYHRYKEVINGNSDIIDGVTNLIDGSLFFDTYSGRTYTGYTNPIITVNRGTTDIGFHPYYEDVFHQIVNGYLFFNPVIGPDSYNSAINTGITKSMYQYANGGTAWATVIDNSKFNSTDKRYTLLPGNGYNTTDATSFVLSEQENFRTIWNVGTVNAADISYSGYTFPSSYEYLKLTGSTDNYSLGTNYRKVVDLIATFKPDILDVFEQAFLDFASEKLNEEIQYKRYDVKYDKFQSLLQKIVSVTKNDNDPTDNHGLILTVKTKQITELGYLTNELLSNENLIKISLANPREIDNYVLGGFTGLNVKNFSVSEYDTADSDLIKLYLGEDLSGYYHDFFVTYNIGETEENILQFRFIIYIYAGLRVSGINKTKSEFIQYLKDNIITAQDNRLDVFLTQLITQMQKNLKVQTADKFAKRKRGYHDDPIKLELYNYFKSFNDKWTAGNSIGQRTLMEEFLFLDKANRDIGSKVFLDLNRLHQLMNSGNEKINLYSLIGMLVQDSGFDIRALPAYVNFYGTNFSNTKKITPSKSVAQNMFGAFLEVDYQESSPKIILQYIGPTSKHLELSEINNKYKFKNDGFNVGDVNNNPIVVAPDIFTKMDFSKSNKVVAFEVSFGDQNQSIFKGVELDQSSIKNTSESFEVLERLGKSETGASTAQVDIGLFDIYRQSSYQCQVTCMGNVMIQPTMYFYLKNIPLFKGSYWITEVIHNIKTTGIETMFKGTRIPSQSLPNPTDSFMASYRSLFDKLVKKASQKVEEEKRQQLSGTTNNEKVITTAGGTYSFNTDNINIPGEKLVQDAGLTQYGIPYNGFGGEKNIQLVNYNGSQWLRARAVLMGGSIYKIADDISMNILSRLGGPEVTWNDVKGYSDKQNFYVSKFDINYKINPTDLISTYTKTEFLKPKKNYVETSGDVSIIVNTNINTVTHIYEGPISIGPATPPVLNTKGYVAEGYGIGLSKSLMTKLKLADGDVVYFRMS